jgi:DMSO/TMAO reductase YedYZ molybdopterin-dependent catalytic subunit
MSTLRRARSGPRRPPPIGPFRPDAFPSRLRSERVAAVLGIALGVSFTVCFATGLYSHVLQTPPGWFDAFPRPAGLYRATQGVHVTTGLATIPLLAAKLWVVYPRLFEWPPVRSVAHAVERLMLLPLIGGSLFLLVSGVNNINLAYPYAFSFRSGHYSAAWITIGALVVHIGAKAPVARRALRRGSTRPRAEAAADRRDALARRRFLVSVFGLSALAAGLTVGQTFRPLRRLALLAPRRPDFGPQGFPVNRTAASVGLTDVDLAGYRLVVAGPGAARPRSYTYDELSGLPQHEATLPIACVEGWSASKRWCGVRVRDLLAASGARDAATVSVVSLQMHPLYRRSELTAAVATDPDALLALAVDGERLHPDHGFPCRLIAPNRPGVMQTKWVTRVEVA